MQVLKKLNFYTVLLFFILCSAVALALTSAKFLIGGNIHDIFIPYNVAYALQQKLTLHHDFHTSLGFIYSDLNYAALSLIRAWPQYFQIQNLVVLSSIIFATGFLLTWVLTRLRYAVELPRVSCFILLILVALLFQVRNMSSLDFKELLWYGTYNHHLWSLLLLQISYVFCWQYYLQTQQKSTLKIFYFDIVILSLFQALILYISLNYKITFFIASGFVAVALCLLIPRSKKWAYILLTLLFFTGLIILAIANSYDYIAYFKDIQQALVAKENGNINVNIYITIGIYGLFYILFLQIYRQYSSAGWQAFSFFNIFSKNNLLLLGFDALIAFGLFFAILGDYQKPGIYFIIAAALYVITNKNSLSNKQLFTWVAYSFLLIFFIINLLSLFRIAQYSDYQNTKKRYTSLSIESSAADFKLSFVVKKEFNLFNIYKAFKLDKHPEKNAIFSKLSYTYAPGYSTEQPLLPFFNPDYITGLNETITDLNSLGPQTDNKLLMLEFVNPLPLLLNAKFPQPSYHWVHLGTTFSTDSLTALYPSFADSDFVIMPILSRDGLNQTFLNCTFYLWNLANNSPFKIYKVSSLMIYFTTAKNLSKYNLTEEVTTNVNPALIKQSCAEIRHYIEQDQ